MANEQNHNTEETLHIKKPIAAGKEIKDSPIKKAAKVFFAEDIDKVVNSIGDDFIKPRAKSFGNDLIQKFKRFMFDSWTGFVGRILWGNSSSTKSNNYYNDYNGYDNSSRSSYTSYATKYSDDYYYNGNYYKSNVPYSSVPHDIVRERAIESEGEAYEVLRALKDAIRDYGFCSIADYYMAVSKSNDDRPPAIDKLDYQYGWRGDMLSHILKPTPVPAGGFILNLPKPVPKAK